MERDEGSIFPRVMRVVRTQGWSVLLERGRTYTQERLLGRTRMHFFKPRFLKALATASNLEDAIGVLYDFRSFGLTMQPYQRREEISQFMRLVEDSRPRTVLEIGTGFGGTLILFARTASEDARIIGLDLPPKMFSISCPRWRESVIDDVATAHQTMSILRGNSHEDSTLQRVRQFIGDRRLDVLFIDGDHSYLGVKKDFDMYSPLVRKGGMVGFHDIAPHNIRPDIGVGRFWEELKGVHRFKEIITQDHMNGIGIVYLD